MNIQILCVGKIKENFYAEAIAEYCKRISRFHLVKIVEVAEGKIIKNPKPNEIELIKAEESENLLKFLKGYVILLDVMGASIDSVKFSQKLDEISLHDSTITFVIGGSYGVSEDFKSKADYKLSFSHFTFPHQLMRVILLEQIYRATTISKGITYHK